MIKNPRLGTLLYITDDSCAFSYAYVNGFVRIIHVKTSLQYSDEFSKVLIVLNESASETNDIVCYFMGAKCSLVRSSYIMDSRFFSSLEINDL